MATPYVTGPVHVWVIVPRRIAQIIAVEQSNPSYTAQTGGYNQGGASANPTTSAAGILNIVGGSAIYIGTGMEAPDVETVYAYAPIMNDITGPTKQFDKIKGPKDAYISISFTRWNQPVIEGLEGTFPGMFGGAMFPGEVGTMMMTEGAAFGLVLRYGNTDFHGALAGVGQRFGRRYFAATIEGRQRDKGGTGQNSCTVLFHCQPVFIPATNVLALYDFNVAGIPPTAPN
jgi:hypothetical protein